MKKRTKLHQQTGAAVVEFAVLLFLILILLLGIIEFGFLWLQNNYIAHASREGARVASKVNSTEDDVKNAVKDYLKGLYNETDVDTDCCEAGDFIEIVYNPDETSSTDANGTAIYTSQVTVTVETAKVWEPILWGFLNQNDITHISETAVFAKEDQTDPNEE
ncbi:hypothetical protein GWO43_10040 [candidate division KSB1 bacterium]|nr:hypothetical protein [candidate division KSB1 bacterium]NIR69536.1 hypothetical protein [candidate division KSB1 bacterium]NIS24303.1 hypothetical protein [candidate division KSB1 bacterium]NIT71221.1 hypothetical protein [candidate division KSB1 bacterium]NIU24925.1 hypothetical protein [candidate division KSB1 bacterium]